MGGPGRGAETPRREPLRATALGLLVTGGALLVLMVGAYLWQRGIQTGIQCDNGGQCEVQGGDLPRYLAIALVRSAAGAVTAASAFALALGGLTLAVLRRLPAPAPAPAPTGDAMPFESAGAETGAGARPDRSRLGLRAVWVVVLAVLAVALVGMIVAAHPSMQYYWNSGICTSSGCDYPLEAQLALLVSALSPQLFAAALLTVPLLVLASPVLAALRRQTPDARAAGQPDALLDPTAAGPAAPRPAEPHAMAALPGAHAAAPGAAALPLDTAPVSASSWWDELDDGPRADSDGASDPGDDSDGSDRRRSFRRRRNHTWDGRDLSPFMRPDAE